MKITNNNYSPNFKGINVISISKKAFKQTPADMFKFMQEYDEAFNKAYNNAKYNGLTKKIADFLTKTGIFRPSEKATFSFIESPAFTFGRIALQELGLKDNSLRWLIKHTGIPLRQSFDTNHYRAFVFTDKHKDKVSSIFSEENIKKLDRKFYDEAVQRGLPLNCDDTEIVIAANISSALDNQFVKAAKGQPITKFEIDNLSELEDVIPKLN